MAERSRGRTRAGQSNGSDAGDTKIDLIRADTLEPTPIRWIWPGWIATGKLHLLAGRAGTGKTTIATKIAATISLGGTWPDGTTAEQGDVAIWSGEDGVEDTLLPRLLAAGADTSRLRFVGDVTTGQVKRPFIPATDIPALATELDRIPNLRLVILDPVIVAVSGDSNKSGDVRRGLQPLADLAERHKVAVLGITHFNKGIAGNHQLDRVTGSLAWGAAARIVLGTAQGDGDRRLVRLKSNLGIDEGGFSYNLTQASVSETSSMTAQTVQWGEMLEGSGNELLAELEPDQAVGTTKLSLACNWLETALVTGEKAATKIRTEANSAGHTWRTIERATMKLGVHKKKSGEDGGWVWELPKTAN